MISTFTGAQPENTLDSNQADSASQTGSWAEFRLKDRTTKRLSTTMIVKIDSASLDVKLLGPAPQVGGC